MVARVLIFVLAALLTLPLAEMTDMAVARKHAQSELTAQGKAKFKTVKKSFSNSASITINDDAVASLYPSIIKVNGFKKAKITDVNVILRSFDHGFTGDVDIFLAASQIPGRSATVMSDVGGANDALNATLTLDDNAALPLPEIIGGGGKFQPVNFGLEDPFPAPAPDPNGSALLNTFNGRDPNGTWRLFVVDDEAVGDGDISGGWSLEITAESKVKKKKKK